MSCLAHRLQRGRYAAMCKGEEECFDFGAGNGEEGTKKEKEIWMCDSLEWKKCEVKH